MIAFGVYPQHRGLTLEPHPPSAMSQISNLSPHTSEPPRSTVKKYLAPLRGTLCYEKLQLLHRCFIAELRFRDSNPGKFSIQMLSGATNVELIWGLHQISKELVRILMFFESSRNAVRYAVRNPAMRIDDLPVYLAPGTICCVGEWKRTKEGKESRTTTTKQNGGSLQRTLSARLTR